MVVAGLLATATGGRMPAPLKASLLGVAAGVAFGVTAGLLKLTGTVLTDGSRC